jgi:hypothetical protein
MDHKIISSNLSSNYDAPAIDYRIDYIINRKKISAYIMLIIANSPNLIKALIKIKN